MKRPGDADAPSQPTSSRWASAWNADGVDGLRPSFGAERPPKLSDDQFPDLCTILDGGRPWTPREIHALIKDQYDVTYDPAHLSRRLRAAGMHYAKPRPMDPRRPADAEEILAERLDQALGESTDDTETSPSNRGTETAEVNDPLVLGFFR